MYKLIATDIDDTLLAPDGTLPAANKRALESLHNHGVAVVLSSGRATVSMRPLALEMLPPADDEYLISYNGARVTTLLSDTVLHERLLSRESIEIVMDYARREGILVQGYRKADFIAEQATERVKKYAADTGMAWKQVTDLTTALSQGSPKLLMIGVPEAMAGHKERLEVLAEGRFIAVSSKPEYLEIVSPGVSKGDALQRLAEHLHIPIAETIAVGDSINDREMLMAAGLGVAVANARDELKAVADVVLERSAAEGAIEEIKERFWDF